MASSSSSVATPSPTPISSSSKKTKGRQKVEMVRMEKDSNRQVTFSKRRYGLFKKANELCILCGAEAAIIVFSPGRKAYSFGHPSVDDTLNRFILSKSSSSTSETHNESHVDDIDSQSACISAFNIQLDFVNHQIEIMQKSNEEIGCMKKAKEQVYWWDRSVEELSFIHLGQLKSALESLKREAIQIDKNHIMLQASNVANHFSVMGINYPMYGYFNGAMFDPNNSFVRYGQNYYY